jgi:hypothetical protein
MKATLAPFTAGQLHPNFRSFFLDPSSLEDGHYAFPRNVGHTAAQLRIIESSKLVLFAYLRRFN